MKLCSIEDCDKPSRSRRMCMAHYMRVRIHGTVGDTPIRPHGGSRYMESSGYVSVYRKGHPLANGHGIVREHRVVLWEKIGPGVHPCHWCGAEVEWGATDERCLEVDHLDWDRGNNDADNLVPACHSCNASRMKQ